MVTILVDRDGYEICFVEDEAFYDLATPTYDVVDFAARAKKGGDGHPPPTLKQAQGEAGTQPLQSVTNKEGLDQVGHHRQGTYGSCVHGMGETIVGEGRGEACNLPLAFPTSAGALMVGVWAWGRCLRRRARARWWCWTSAPGGARTARPSCRSCTSSPPPTRCAKSLGQDFLTQEPVDLFV